MIGGTLLRKLKTLWEMDPNARAASLRAWGIVPLVELGLRCVTLPTLCRALGLRVARAEEPIQTSAESVEVDSAELRQARRATAQALRNWGVPRTCLRHALVTGYLLRARGPWLVLGVRHERRGWEAHAWLRIGGTRVDSSAEGASFLPLRAPLARAL